MKRLAILIIIVGILIAISPIAGNLYLHWRENRLLDEWYNSEDANAADALAVLDTDPVEGYGLLDDAFAADARYKQDDVITSNLKSQLASNTSIVSENSLDNTSGNAIGNTIGNTSENTTSDTSNKPLINTKSSSKPKPAASQVVLGVIKIDKIKVKYPIVEGAAAANLKVAIGHIPGTAVLGQTGNCALAGHRNYTFGRFFNRLDELEKGDIISISTKKEEFKYKVYEKLVVKPDDVSVIKGSKEDTVLTLITCTPIYVATHRLIIHARLEEKVLLVP